MANAKSRYVLESQNENERLERQSRMKAFDYREELQYLKLSSGQRVLDAGCGSGIVTDYITSLASGIQAVGWDYSQDRVEEAKQKYGSNKNTVFAQKNLIDLKGEPDSDVKVDGRFDAVVCRFVLRHFSPADMKKVVEGFLNILKPGGTLYCVDVDGVMGDVTGASPFLRRALTKLRDAKGVNFQAPREMPALLMETGFQNVDWHLMISEFKGDELVQEIENLQQTMKNAEAFAKKVLGGATQLKRFQKEYLAALAQPGYVHFYTKVIAVGVKPLPKPQLIV